MRILGSVFLLASGCAGASGTDESDAGVPLAELLGILITPNDPVVSVGDEVQLAAMGLYDDRTSVDLTSAVTWHTADAAVVTVSSDMDEEGLAAGAVVGKSEVWAETEGLASVPITVNVTAAEVLGLAVEPGSVSIGSGSTVQLTATTLYSDGTRADGSAQVRWITDDGAIATLESAGLLTATGAGSTLVHAEWGALVSNEVPVEVAGGASNSGIDLEVAGVSAEGAGGVITLTVSVENDGSLGAAGFWVDVYLDPTTTAVTGAGDSYSYIDYLGPEETRDLTFSLDASEGAHTLIIWVDSLEDLEEIEETDNVSEAAVTVVGDDSSGANLTIPYFEWFADDGWVYYAVDVFNSGSASAGAFSVDLLQNAMDEPVPEIVGDARVSRTGLAPGKTTYSDFFVEFECGACWSWVLADSEATVTETDEMDNAASSWVSGD
jgi:hypothetical protein